MKEQDLKEFEKWWLASKYNQVVYPMEGWEQIAKDAWAAAIAYEQNKTMRTYRWDGVLR